VPSQTLGGPLAGHFLLSSRVGNVERPSRQRSVRRRARGCPAYLLTPRLSRRWSVAPARGACLIAPAMTAVR